MPAQGFLYGVKQPQTRKCKQIAKTEPEILFFLSTFPVIQSGGLTRESVFYTLSMAKNHTNYRLLIFIILLSLWKLKQEEIMAVISMKQLLEAGVHFGHQTRRWNPKMAPYIFTERNGIYIIDLQKTVKLIEAAYDFVRETAANDGTILFVGTKKQAQDSIKEEALRCGMYYINNRWLGGTLTNFTTIKKRVQRLEQLGKMEENGQFDVLTKKEVAKLRLEKEKLEKNLGGIREMKQLPSALFVVDPRKEHIAVSEAKRLGIPVVAIVDTNCDPDDADYVIPGNDDAIRAVKLIAETLSNAVIEGRQGEDALAILTQKTEEPAESEEQAEVKEESTAAVEEQETTETTPETVTEA